MSYLDDSKKMFSQVAYNDYSMTRDLPTLIVNYFSIIIKTFGNC